MKRLTTVAACCLVFSLSACRGPRLRHVDGDEFLRLAESSELAHSIQWSTYVGRSWTRAYLELTSILPLWWGGTTVYWTELGELPRELTKQLQVGDSPWVPCGHPNEELRGTLTQESGPDSQ